MITMMLWAPGYSWTLHAIDGDRVFLIDGNRSGDRSLTNAARDVVEECRTIFGRSRLIYLGSDDIWAEMLHDGHGGFIGYAPYLDPVPDRFAEMEEWSCPPGK